MTQSQLRTSLIKHLILADMSTESLFPLESTSSFSEECMIDELTDVPFKFHKRCKKMLEFYIYLLSNRTIV